jgi:hypothetical protein
MHKGIGPERPAAGRQVFLARGGRQGDGESPGVALGKEVLRTVQRAQ